MKRVGILLYALAVLLLHGCSDTPPVSTFEEIIVAHFGALRYDVVEMHIESVREIPISKKQYMGVPAYIIYVSSLVLQPRESLPNEKVQRWSFDDVKISVKKNPAGERNWIVTGLEGIDSLSR